MMDEIMRQEERILLKEPLNKSSAAEQRIFFPIHAEWKTGNTRSIPLFSILLSEKKSLAVSSCRFNQSFLNQIAKLTEEGHLAWDCVAYNPIGFLDKDEYSEQSACICQMFQFEATIGGLPHELELAEYINVPSGKMDLAVTLTRNELSRTF